MRHLVTFSTRLIGSYHHISNLSNPDGPLRRYVVAGNICESGDVFTLCDGEGEGYAFPASAEYDSARGGAADREGHDHRRPGTRLLPELRLGDAVAFHCAGAYGFVMASEYNLRPRPAEAVVLLCRQAAVGDSLAVAEELASIHAPSLIGFRWHLLSSVAPERDPASPEATGPALWAVSRAAMTVDELVEQHLRC